MWHDSPVANFYITQVNLGSFFLFLSQNDVSQDDEGEFFWDPMSAKNRNSKNQNHGRQLQEQLAQATVRIRDLETELKRVQKVRYSFS